MLEQCTSDFWGWTWHSTWGSGSLRILSIVGSRPTPWGRSRPTRKGRFDLGQAESHGCIYVLCCPFPLAYKWGTRCQLWREPIHPTGSSPGTRRSRHPSWRRCGSRSCAAVVWTCFLRTDLMSLPFGTRLCFDTWISFQVDSSSFLLRLLSGPTARTFQHMVASRKWPYWSTRLF